MLQPKPGSVTTVNMEIMQEKDKPNLNEFDDLLSKVSRGTIPNGREIGKIVTIAVSILTDSWDASVQKRARIQGLRYGGTLLSHLLLWHRLVPEIGLLL